MPRFDSRKNRRGTTRIWSAVSRPWSRHRVPLAAGLAIACVLGVANSTSAVTQASGPFQNGGTQANAGQPSMNQGQQGSIQQQGSIPQQGTNPQNASGIVQQPYAANQMLPRPFPELPQAHIDYLTQLLEYWEHSSDKVQLFECGFERWKYDGVFGARRDENGEMPFKAYEQGQIKFKAPDKAFFSVERSWQYVQPADQNQEPYQASDILEKWICDGSYIYEYNFVDKQLIKSELPPELRGRALANGPMPFLFGAKKDELWNRYWLRCTTPEGAEGEYWLEAFPKYPVDARNFFKVEIILDEKDFLPKATRVYDPAYDAQTNPTYQVFRFNNRKIYEQKGLTGPILKMFERNFYEPKPERGWTLVENPYNPTSTASQPQPNNSNR